MNLDQKLIHLPVQEQKMLRELLREFAVLLPDVPGRTTVAVHVADVGDSSLKPVKLKLIRLEMDYVLQNGIIKRSQIHVS